MSKGDKKTGRRKKKWIKIAVPIAVVLVVVLFVKNSMKGASAGIPVYTQTVSVGDIDTQLSVSGKVMAEEATTFFAPANAKIEAIEVTKGDVVKAERRAQAHRTCIACRSQKRRKHSQTHARRIPRLL